MDNFPEEIHGLVCVGCTGESIRGERVYIIECPYCAGEFEATQSHVRKKRGRNQRDHCGCQTRLRRGKAATGRSPTNKIDDRQRVGNQVWAGCKGSAKRKGLPFDLTRGNVYNLIFQACHYCGAEPCRVRPMGQGDWVRPSPPTNGVDRADSSMGYTLDNVLSCCSVCNYMKRDLHYEDFLNKIRQIYQTENGRHKYG